MKKPIEIEIPDSMPAEMLDRRLADGWLRSGSVIYRVSMLCIDEAVHGLVHIRLPLNTFSPSRSQRRLLRRNRARFRVQFGPAQVDRARRQLYEATKPRMVHFVASDLETLVFTETPGIFDTRECAVYDGQRLIAVSYFDVGCDSVVSQLALYDPAYARHSLGIYTLLEEIEFSRALSSRYFYPGYIIPDLPGFEYKLRIGDLQYLEGRRWRRRKNPPTRIRSADRYTRQISQLEGSLSRAGIQFQRRYYAPFSIGYISILAGLTYLRGLVHLRIDKEIPGDDGNKMLVIIDCCPEEGQYRLCLACPDDDIDFMSDLDPVGESAASWELRTLCRKRDVLTTSSASELVDAVHALVA